MNELIWFETSHNIIYNAIKHLLIYHVFIQHYAEKVIYVVVEVEMRPNTALVDGVNVATATIARHIWGCTLSMLQLYILF